MSEFTDPFADGVSQSGNSDGPDPLGGEISEADQAALSEASSLPIEELPPPRGDEPLLTVLQALKRKPVRVPEPTVENARSDVNAAVLLEAWGEQAFLDSTFYVAWQSEWRHQCLKDEIQVQPEKPSKEKRRR